MEMKEYGGVNEWDTVEWRRLVESNGGGVGGEVEEWSNDGRVNSCGDVERMSVMLVEKRQGGGNGGVCWWRCR